MSEKTRHEILEEVYHNANNQLFSVPMKLGVIAMQAYADQEKRSTAIAFAKWIEQNAYWMPSKERWHLHKAESFVPEGYVDNELYDLFINSL